MAFNVFATHDDAPGRLYLPAHPDAWEWHPSLGARPVIKCPGFLHGVDLVYATASLMLRCAPDEPDEDAPPPPESVTELSFTFEREDFGRLKQRLLAFDDRDRAMQPRVRLGGRSLSAHAGWEGVMQRTQRPERMPTSALPDDRFRSGRFSMSAHVRREQAAIEDSEESAGPTEDELADIATRRAERYKRHENQSNPTWRTHLSLPVDVQAAFLAYVYGAPHVTVGIVNPPWYRGPVLREGEGVRMQWTSRVTE